jgi:hypothetical protein
MAEGTVGHAVSPRSGSGRFGTPGISAVSRDYLAGVLAQLGRFDEAIGHTEVGMTHWLEKAETEMRELAWST